MKKKVFLSVAIVVLAVMLVSVFVACTPSVDKVDEKFKEEKYLGGAVESEDAIAGMTGAAVYTKVLEGEMITIWWFESSDDAKAAYEDAKSDGSKKNLCKRGKPIAFGTEGAIDLFKKII